MRLELLVYSLIPSIIFSLLLSLFMPEWIDTIETLLGAPNPSFGIGETMVCLAALGFFIPLLDLLNRKNTRREKRKKEREKLDSGKNVKDLIRFFSILRKAEISLLIVVDEHGDKYKFTKDRPFSQENWDNTLVDAYFDKDISFNERLELKKLMDFIVHNAEQDNV